MKTVKLYVIVLLGVLFAGQVLAQSDHYLPAYLEISDVPTLVITDSANSPSPTSRYPIPVPSEWMSAGRTTLNPYTKSELWIARILWAPGEKNTNVNAIQILNLTTGSGRTFVLRSFDTENLPMFLWSLNGRYLAIRASIDTPDLDLYIYSLENESLINLTGDSSRQMDFSWSADGSRLTVFTTACRTSEPLVTCEQAYSLLEVYDVQGHIRTHQLDLSAFVASGTQACQPAFSQSAIAFTSYCNSLNSADSLLDSDVYVWYPDENVVQQVTTLGEQIDYPKEGFYSVYDYVWLSDGTLLVGADYRIISSNPREGHQLLSYTPDGAIQVLSETLGAGFSVNPVTNDVILATRSSEFVMNPALDNPPIQTYRTTSALLQSDTAARLLTSEAAEMTIPGTTTMPLVWSPDGTMAYGLVVETSENGYARETGEIVFFDAATDEMRSFTPPSSGADVTIVPLGWVSAETVR